MSQMFDSDNNQRVDEDEFFAFLKCSLLEARLNTKEHDTEGEEHLHQVYSALTVLQRGVRRLPRWLPNCLKKRSEKILRL